MYKSSIELVHLTLLGYIKLLLFFFFLDRIIHSFYRFLFAWNSNFLASSWFLYIKMCCHSWCGQRRKKKLNRAKKYVLRGGKNQVIYLYHWKLIVITWIVVRNMMVRRIMNEMSVNFDEFWTLNSKRKNVFFTNFWTFLVKLLFEMKKKNNLYES